MSKFRLSALASVCFFLASCGGGSGDNSISTNYEPEPRPPGPDRLTATGGGDGENQEEEKRKIVVNIQQEEEENEEENDIIVEQPEEKSESEEEENNNNEEETPQQLTIIEEEDFPYVPPEEEEPRYSAQAQPQTQSSGNSLARTLIPEPKAIENCGDAQYNPINCAPAVGHSSSFLGTGYTVDYTVNNNWYSSGFVNLQGKDRDLEANLIGRTNNAAFRPSDANYNFRYKNIDPLKYVEVTYEKEDGFEGFYSYKGDSGQITEDVTLKVRFNNPSIKALLIEGYIGDSGGITIEGTHFGQIRFSANRADNGQFLDSNQVHFSNLGIRAEKGFNEVRGSFKNDGSSTSFPSQVVGELKMKRFFDTSPARNQNVYEYNDNLFKRGDNALAGVFVADKDTERERRIVPLEKHLEGSIGMFDYGLWANENFSDNRIVFLEQTTKFNPGRTASDYTAHTYKSLGSVVEARYKREDGFKGAYIYEGETGELTGDVDLYVNFGLDSTITSSGSILTDLEIGGYDLKGIVMRNARIAGSGTDNTHNNGVGGIDIDADGLDDSNTSARLSFGDYLADSNGIDSATVNHHGLVRKVRLVLSSDGIQAQGSTPETYPSQIAGELEINQFKIKESDGDSNTIIGVFVADKQE